MRTIEVNLYQFSELSDKAKENAIAKLSDINVDHDWWDNTYDDAESVGLKITGFDLDRNRHCKGEFIDYAFQCAEKTISEHGESCETYKTAKKFLSDWNDLVEKYSDGINKDKVLEENESEFDPEADELENEFLRSILEDYSIMLQEECEYLQGDEAIIETIEANEYEFLEDGTLA